MIDFKEDMAYILSGSTEFHKMFTCERPLDPPDVDDITDDEIEFEADRLIDEFMKLLKPHNRILSEIDIKRLEDAIRPIAMNNL